MELWGSSWGGAEKPQDTHRKTGSMLGILHIFVYGVPNIHVKRIFFPPRVMWAKKRW